MFNTFNPLFVRDYSLSYCGSPVTLCSESPSPAEGEDDDSVEATSHHAAHADEDLQQDIVLLYRI